MSEDERGSWSNYWLDRRPGQACLPNAPANVEQTLAGCWESFALMLPTSARVIDLACGNGAVIRVLSAHRADLSLLGVDYADTAGQLTDLNIHGGVDCTALPFEDGSFDAATSQFGIEYCGEEAAAEMLRVLKCGGRFQLITHYTESVFSLHNAARCDAIASLIGAGTFAIARETASGCGSDAASEQVLAIRERWRSQSVVEEIIAAIRQAFAMGPRALARIDELEVKARREHARLQAMVKAALDETEMRRLISELQGRGASAGGDLVRTAGDSLPLAWRIAGRVAG